ncbi:MAG: sulfoacetaldehyde acetyltransferase, partial [Polynucleobacter sp.]|nr:sulfoacetaldehyde acetyltransferase [Polynucleobacter sp.]
FYGNNPLAVGPIGYQGSEAAMRLLSESDLILVLGSRLNSFGTTPQYGIDFFPKEAKLIHNSINPLELGSLRPMNVGLLGDCKAVTLQLLEGLKGYQFNGDVSARLSHIKKLKEEWANKLKEMSLVEGDPIPPRRALWEVSQAVSGKDVSIVADVGNISGSANAYFTSFKKPRSWFAAGSLGGIGVGYATAMGVSLAKPNENIIALVGDGAWSMSLQEVMTTVREKLNFVTVIFNNQVYGAERRNQYDFFGKRYFYTDLENPSFATIATQMGAVGIQVDRAADIGDAIKGSLGQSKPIVIEIMTDPAILNEPYRRDALQQPVRELDKYRKYINEV